MARKTGYTVLPLDYADAAGAYIAPTGDVVATPNLQAQVAQSMPRALVYDTSGNAVVQRQDTSGNVIVQPQAVTSVATVAPAAIPAAAVYPAAYPTQPAATQYNAGYACPPGVRCNPANDAATAINQTMMQGVDANGNMHPEVLNILKAKQAKYAGSNAVYAAQQALNDPAFTSQLAEYAKVPNMTQEQAYTNTVRDMYAKNGFNQQAVEQTLAIMKANNDANASQRNAAIASGATYSAAPLLGSSFTDSVGLQRFGIDSNGAVSGNVNGQEIHNIGLADFAGVLNGNQASVLQQKAVSAMNAQAQNEKQANAAQAQQVLAVEKAALRPENDKLSPQDELRMYAEAAKAGIPFYGQYYRNEPTKPADTATGGEALYKLGDLTEEKITMLENMGQKVVPTGYGYFRVVPKLSGTRVGLDGSKYIPLKGAIGVQPAAANPFASNNLRSMLK